MREMLDRGRRFAVVDRLPMSELNQAEGTAIYWLLSSMVSRPVAQKLDGTMIYDVLDTGPFHGFEHRVSAPCSFAKYRESYHHRNRRHQQRRQHCH